MFGGLESTTRVVHTFKGECIELQERERKKKEGSRGDDILLLESKNIFKAIYSKEEKSNGDIGINEGRLFCLWVALRLQQAQ